METKYRIELSEQQMIDLIKCVEIQRKGIEAIVKEHDITGYWKEELKKTKKLESHLKNIPF